MQLSESQVGPSLPGPEQVASPCQGCFLMHGMGYASLRWRGLNNTHREAVLPEPALRAQQVLWVAGAWLEFGA